MKIEKKKRTILKTIAEIEEGGVFESSDTYYIRTDIVNMADNVICINLASGISVDFPKTAEVKYCSDVTITVGVE